MGAMGKKIYSFLLTKFTGSYLEIFINNIIKMWEQFRILKFPFIILFILIGGIFLISSSDLVYMFISIELQSYGRYICAILHRNSEFSTTVVLLHYIYPFYVCAIIPIKSYSNAEADKRKILKENKNKSGIYSWKNLINDKQYIGSAINLSKRLEKYYSTTYMEDVLNRSNSHIYRALLKNGHSNFSLEILEYCSPDKCLEREDYYLCSLPHEYNILPGSWLGHKHSNETKKILSETNTEENNPMFGQNHTDESKKIMSPSFGGMLKKISPEGCS